MKQVLWYLVAGTRGGQTRARIIREIAKRPANTHQLAKRLGLDYKTVQHHLKIQVENHILSVLNQGKYAAGYFLSNEVNENRPEFEQIWEEFGKT